MIRSSYYNNRSYSTEKPKVVGFIGLGNMGAPMARNLAKKGFHLVVHDVSKEVTEKFATDSANNAKPAYSPSEVAAHSDYIVTMLPSSPHVDSVYLQKGILSTVRPGTLLIDTSTIEPSVARKVGEQASKSKEGVEFIDAPVSGGTVGAEAGTLTFMVGGSAAAFERAKPLLQAMGKNLVHCGASGNGQAVKICNNLVLGITMLGLSEALNLGVQLGLDPKLLAGIFNTSSARCWSGDTNNPVPGVLPNSAASRGYTGGFGVDLMKKDLGLAVSAARSANARLVFGEACHQFYEEVSQSGSGKKDFSLCMITYVKLLKLPLKSKSLENA